LEQVGSGIKREFVAPGCLAGFTQRFAIASVFKIGQVLLNFYVTIGNLLPKNLREVLVLKEYGDLDYQEIAKILGISVGNVKVRAHRARTRLAVVLEEKGV